MVQVSQLIGAVWFIYGLLEGCMVHLQPISRLYGSTTACWKAVQFIVQSIYGLLEGCMVYYMVHLWSVRRLHGSFTACWQTTRFNYGLLEGHTAHLQPIGRPYGLLYGPVSRTYGQLGAPFGRQHRRHLRRNFLCIFVFMVLFLCISFVFYGFIKANYRDYTPAVLFLSTASYSTYCMEEFPTYFCVLWFYFLCISFIFYGLIEAITEALHRWFHFSSTASV